VPVAIELDAFQSIISQETLPFKISSNLVSRKVEATAQQRKGDKADASHVSSMLFRNTLESPYPFSEKHSFHSL
jgi:hypothetical protein